MLFYVEHSELKDMMEGEIMGIPAYADRMANVSGSAVREILKLTQQPDMISFGGGLPSADSFPMEDLKDIINQITEHMTASAIWGNGRLSAAA